MRLVDLHSVQSLTMRMLAAQSGHGKGKHASSLLQAWRQGNTGYPMVDASMRQLWSTGWLHNKSRVICASFLVKNLLLPWQWGLKHYWDCLLDADLECDALGWQYCSGCLAGEWTFLRTLLKFLSRPNLAIQGNKHLFQGLQSCASLSWAWH